MNTVIANTTRMGSPFLDALMRKIRQQVEAEAEAEAPVVVRPAEQNTRPFTFHQVIQTPSIPTPIIRQRLFQDRSPGSSSVLDMFNFVWVYDSACVAPSTKHKWRLCRDGAGNPIVDTLSSWTNFGFTIPVGATIIGVIATLSADLAQVSHGAYQIDCFSGTTSELETPGEFLPSEGQNHIYVRINQVSAVGKNLAMADGSQVHGAEEDLWGALWDSSPEVVNDITFGIDMKVSPIGLVGDFFSDPFFAMTPTAGTPPTAIPSEDLNLVVTNVRVYYEI